MESVPLVKVIRSSVVESLHRGMITVVNKEGEVLTALGGADEITFIRSAAKPVQALPLVATGAAARFNLTQRELAVTCASHNGEEIHVETIKGMLEKGGLSEEDLACGIHYPYDQEAARRLMERGERPSPVHNNCSGKHTGMLLLCRHMGWPFEGYIEKEHPLQQMMHGLVAKLAGMERDEVGLGVDGCGVTVFALPLHKMAYLFARLSHPVSLPPEYREAAIRVVAAMRSEPYMVGGRKRLCTQLMECLPDKLVAKAGAEAVYCVGLLGKGVGVSVKIEDGRSRGMGPVIITVLRQLGILNEEELSSLQDDAWPPVKNHRGEVVGSMEVAFSLPGKEACLHAARIERSHT